MKMRLILLLGTTVGLAVGAHAAGPKANVERRAEATPSADASMSIAMAPTPDKGILDSLERPFDQVRTPKAAAGPAATGYTKDMQDYPQQNGRSNSKWGSVLTDIVRHLPASNQYQDAYVRYTRAGDLVTAGHEWTHFLNAYLGARSGVGKSSYYVLDNRYITLSDPGGLRGIVPYVPTSLRGELYDLYLVQNSGNAKVDPLYLCDEWTAYINDVTVAVDQLDEGKPLNSVIGRTIQTQTAGNVLEFMFYGFAVGMAVKKHDPEYYAGPEGKRLRDFIVFNTRRSAEVYGKAAQRDELSRGDSRNSELIKRFRNSADTAAMRAWVKSDLGRDIANRLR